MQWQELLVVSVLLWLLFSRVLVSPLLEQELMLSAVVVVCSEEVSMRIKEQSST